MAVKTLYVLAQNASAPNYWGPLQDGGSAPTAANTAYGFNPSTSTAPQYMRGRLGATAVSSTKQGTSFLDAQAGPNKGTGTGNTTAGDSFVAGPYTGTFANTAWTFNWKVRATTAGATGRIRMRVWKSVNADGTSAIELTAGAQNGATVNLAATATDYNSSMSWSPGAITLTNEYLFFQVEWHESTTGTWCMGY